MTSAEAANSIVDGCRADFAYLKEKPSTFISNQDAGLAALMRAAGIEACTSTSVAGASLFPPFAVGGAFERGCGSLAAISSQLNATQKILNCTMTKLSSKHSVNVRSDLTLNIILENDVKTSNCKFDISQTNNVGVVQYTSMEDSIVQAMTGEIESSMKQFATNLQNENKKGLFGTSAGQKIIETFKQDVDQKVEQKAFINVVKEVLEDYKQSGTINFTIGARSSIGGPSEQRPRDSRYDELPVCFEVNQLQVMNVVSQNFIKNALDIAFKSKEGNDMVNEIKNSQTKTIDTGVSLPSFATIGIIIAVVIGLIVLMSLKGRAGPNGVTKPVLAGPTGKVLGIVLIVVGFLALIAGVVLLLLKQNVILSASVLVGGGIIATLGVVILIKAKSQQALFEQQLALVTAGRPDVLSPQMYLQPKNAASNVIPLQFTPANPTQVYTQAVQPV